MVLYRGGSSQPFSEDNVGTPTTYNEIKKYLSFSDSDVPKLIVDQETISLRSIRVKNFYF